MNFNAVLVFATLNLAIFLYLVINSSLLSMCELEKCPYCYGTDFCNEFKRNEIKLKHSSFFDLFSNYFSVKNVYYAVHNNKSVVLKKLAHNHELDRLDDLICETNALHAGCDLTELIEEQKNLTEERYCFYPYRVKQENFKQCACQRTFEEVLDLHYLKTYSSHLKKYAYRKHIWTILQLNVEALLIQLLKYEDYWPVPQYLGACGRVVVENDCGSNLNDFADAEWNVRAYIAMQILEAAMNFTERHPLFRFYLTDISPDNIAVDADLRVTFVDLENVIITENDPFGENIYHSVDLADGNNFCYFEEKLCASTLSDHNYYGVCKMLLSKDAPWPMMTGGLLHTPPSDYTLYARHLFYLIERCVHSTSDIDRFKAVRHILINLKRILEAKYDMYYDAEIIDRAMPLLYIEKSN